MMQIIDIIDVGRFSKQHVRFPLDLTYAHIYPIFLRETMEAPHVLYLKKRLFQSRNRHTTYKVRYNLMKMTHFKNCRTFLYLSSSDLLMV